MNLEQIKAAIDAQKTVYWKQRNYEVIKDSNGQYLIQCTHNDDCIGLTHQDGETLNGREEDFLLDDGNLLERIMIEYVNQGSRTKNSFECYAKDCKQAAEYFNEGRSSAKIVSFQGGKLKRQYRDSQEA
jgi:hypothetical protein